MKKKYLIIFICVSILLIVSSITIGVMASKLMNKKSKDVVYEIGETKLSSLAEFYPDDLELINFNYTTDNTIYVKTYNYKLKNDNALAIVSFYNEYLSTDLSFINESEDIISTTQGKYVFEKVFEENSDSLIIEISYTDSTIDIVLSYTYLDD